MTGVAAWHVVNGAPWEGDDTFVSKVRQGSQRLTPLMSKWEQCPPVTLEHLMALQNSLDMNDTFDSAVWVVALICFWACCRLGELTVDSVNLFDPQRHVSRSASFHFRNNVQGDKVIESLHLHLPWTKSTREEGADLAASAHAPLSPADAFRNHLRVNVGAPPGGHLFAFRTPSGTYTPMVKEWFLARCHEIWSTFGLLLPSGHSFRIGGATELLLAGVPPEVVAAIGHWKSLAFLLYWRKIEEILPRAVSKSYVKSRIAEVSKEFERFRVTHRIPAVITLPQ